LRYFSSLFRYIDDVDFIVTILAGRQLFDSDDKRATPLRYLRFFATGRRFQFRIVRCCSFFLGFARAEPADVSYAAIELIFIHFSLLQPQPPLLQRLASHEYYFAFARQLSP